MTVVSPTWSTVDLDQTIFFIYAAADATVTLPPQTETGFNSETYTHTINVISTAKFKENTGCNTYADDMCFTSDTEANNIF